MRKPTKPFCNHFTASIESYFNQLKQAKLKITYPRRIILNYLFQQSHPITINQLYQSVKKDCDWATIFRSLKKFEQAQIVTRFEFGDKQSRYELNPNKVHSHHHHLICRFCRKIEELPYCQLKVFEKKLQQKFGYSELSHALEFFGVCPQCKTKKNKSYSSNFLN